MRMVEICLSIDGIIPQHKAISTLKVSEELMKQSFDIYFEELMRVGEYIINLFTSKRMPPTKRTGTKCTHMS